MVSFQPNIFLALMVIFSTCFFIVSGSAGFVQSGISLVATSNGTPIAQQDLNQFPSWKEKLSSDLLQLLDPSACPPGLAPADIAHELKQFGQLRSDGNRSEVHITITLNSDTNGKNVTLLLNQSTSDPTFGLITGWIPVDQISNLSSMGEIKQIRTVLPPAASALETIPVGSSLSHPGSSQHFANSSTAVSPVSFLNNMSNHTSVASPDSFSLTGNTTWKGKLSTDLLQLLDDRYLSPGQSAGDAVTLMSATGELRRSPGNDTEVMVNSHIGIGSTLSSVRPYFTSAETDPLYGRISGWLSLHNLSRLAQEPGVLSVMSQLPAFTSGITTEGDDILHTREFRNTTNLTGKGMKVGVISDGVTSLDAVIAAGELPSNVHVLRNSIGGDEGTAMFQIVHDISPDAELYFHDRGSSQIEFVQAMDELISDGCQIICDDITYVEPFFEDGYIARYIRDRILSYNILYVTSAGNFAQEHYQAPFNGYMNQGYAWHDFQASNGSKDLKFSAPPHSAGHVILQWDDRFAGILK